MLPGQRKILSKLWAMLSHFCVNPKTHNSNTYYQMDMANDSKPNVYLTSFFFC